MPRLTFLQSMKAILNGARAQHTQAVQDRIDNVERMKDVVGVTKGLFALSKVSHSPSPLVHRLSSEHCRLVHATVTGR